MPFRYTSTAITTNQQWRASGVGLGDNDTGVLAAGNGTTNYGKVVAGTILARHSGTGDLHPCGHAELTAAPSGSATMTVADSSNFYVGDSCAVYDATGSAISTGNVVVSKTATTVVLTSTLTASIGDHLVKESGLYVPLGFLTTTEDTTEVIDDTTVAVARQVSVQMSGDVRASQITGGSTWLNNEALSPGLYRDVADSLNLATPEHRGFRVMSNI